MKTEKILDDNIIPIICLKMRCFCFKRAVAIESCMKKKAFLHIMFLRKAKILKT